MVSVPLPGDGTDERSEAALAALRSDVIPATLEAAGEAHVHEFCAALRRDDDVRGLDVEVHDAAGVDVAQRIGELDEQLVAYVRDLRAVPRQREYDRVVEALTTNETSWYRDVTPFTALTQHVVPEIDGESPRHLAVAVAAEVGARLRELGGRTPVAHAS